MLSRRDRDPALRKKAERALETVQRLARNIDMSPADATAIQDGIARILAELDAA